MLFKTDPTFRRKAAGEVRTTVISFSSSIYLDAVLHVNIKVFSGCFLKISLFWYYIKISEKKISTKIFSTLICTKYTTLFMTFKQLKFSMCASRGDLALKP